MYENFQCLEEHLRPFRESLPQVWQLTIYNECVTLMLTDVDYKCVLAFLHSLQQGTIIGIKDYRS